MATVTGPLFSLDARNSVGKAIVYSSWRGVNYVRGRVIPANPQTVDQTAIRLLVSHASKAWATGATDGTTEIDQAYKEAYSAVAAGQPMSGFNIFMRDCIAKNGGSSYSAPLVHPEAPGDITP